MRLKKFYGIGCPQTDQTESFDGQTLMVVGWGTTSAGGSLSSGKGLLCGQFYKQFMLVIYESRVVIWGIFKSGTTLDV